ncbi:Development and Cell Death domain protein, partial [Prunus dulcis]
EGNMKKVPKEISGYKRRLLRSLANPDREKEQIIFSPPLCNVRRSLSVSDSLEATKILWLLFGYIWLCDPDCIAYTMELDDNYMETDNRKEINSPAVVLNNSESSEQIPSPAEASNNPESSEQSPLQQKHPKNQTHLN